MIHPCGVRWMSCLLVMAVTIGLVASPIVVAAADKPPAKPASTKASPSDPESIDPVELAIRKAVAHLYKVQKGDNWEISPRRNDDEAASVTGAQWGGLSAMATYALLAAGESSQDPRVARAIAWLDKADVIGTYAMGMKLQIWNYIERPSEAQRGVLRKDATLLLNAVHTGGGKGGDLGLYHYWLDPTKGAFDHSCSNYGVLGMWAAAQQNLEVPSKYWQVVDEAWRKGQQKDGGWAYGRVAENGSTLPMTAAGVATLFITQDMVNEGRGGECRGSVEDKGLEAGLKWLSEHYAKDIAGGLNLYAMYNIERVGTASGYKYFGTTDWYRDGAARLLKAQKPDGSWEGGHGAASDIAGTVWGILFLVKGRAPVMMNKLDYSLAEKGVVANWNQRPRDIANLAHWAGKQLEKELNWQIVNLKVSVDDLHDSPVLYIAGNQNLVLGKEDKEKLRQYVEQGGLILGHADCNDLKFTNSFMRLGQELFKSYEWRELPPDHLIYTAHFNGKQWPNRPALRGLSNGARELMVLIPTGDPARYWHIKNFSSKQTEPLAELATNIYLYALDKSTLKSKFKGQTYIVHRNDKIPAVAKVKVARLEYGGNWDPEPAGWRRLAAIMHNERGVDLDVETVKLGTGKLKADTYKLAHLTGTQKFKLTEAQRKELKDYVAGGGTLVVDAAGGAVDFKDAAEAELPIVFGGGAGRSLAGTLPLEHPVYSVGGENLKQIEYRPYARKLLLSGLSTPRLRGIDVNGRTGVYYSPEDLSVGLVGMSMDGIYGYDPDDATDLIQHMVMLAMGGTPPPKLAQGKPAEAQPKPAEKPAAPPKHDDKGKKPGNKADEKPNTVKR